VSYSNKKNAILYFAAGYLLLICALFTVLSSFVSMGVQRKERHHPSHLLKEKGSVTRFLLEMPSSKQKRYLILGITSGILAGFCFGAGYDHSKKSKNQK
jgi:hypothetical protein